MKKIQILLTNDDGIQSPGLWAAAEALSEIGYVTVAAPREQSSGTGRSLPITSDGIIKPEKLTVHGQEWTVYAVGGTPAQAVLHATLEIMPDAPELVVSGINYGENLATGVSVSGTVGAAMEAAALGFRSLAMSLETDRSQHLSYSREVDFSAAAYFTTYFARLVLQKKFPFDVDLIKVDVPSDANPDTPWEMAKLGRQRYYEATAPIRKSWNEIGTVGYKLATLNETEPEDSDVYVVRTRRHVAVTPLSLDFTSRVDLKGIDKLLRE